jgi:transposase-like protein
MRREISGLPPEHWRYLRTDKPLEPPTKAMRRRTRIVGAFPDGQSVDVGRDTSQSPQGSTKLYPQINRLAENRAHDLTALLMTSAKTFAQGVHPAVRRDKAAAFGSIFR